MNAFLNALKASSPTPKLPVKDPTIATVQAPSKALGDTHRTGTEVVPVVTIDLVLNARRIDVFFNAVPSERIRERMKDPSLLNPFRFTNEPTPKWYSKDTNENRQLLRELFGVGLEAIDQAPAARQSEIAVLPVEQVAPLTPFDQAVSHIVADIRERRANFESNVAIKDWLKASPYELNVISASMRLLKKEGIDLNSNGNSDEVFERAPIENYEAPTISEYEDTPFGIFKKQTDELLDHLRINHGDLTLLAIATLHKLTFSRDS